MTNTILSLDTWRALGCEYLDDTWHGQRPAFVDHGASQGWGELLDHVQHHTTFEWGDVVRTWITPERDIVWFASTTADDTITSFEDLVDIIDDETQVPLSDLHHEHPYFSREDNLRFRAWHDTAHYTNGLDFGHDAELLLFGHQARELSPFARNALFCESVYQLAASVVLGGYPDHQYCRRIGVVGRAVRDLLVGLA